MTKTAYLPVLTALAFAVFIFVTAAPVFASHNDNDDEEETNRRWYSSSVQREIDDLDDDEVEEFAIPVLFGVTLRNIYPSFGDPRGGGTREHEGLDIMGILGTPMVTPTDAVVTRTGDGESSGLYVYTANPGGESFRYMHLDAIADIEAGDKLKAGDFIGTVGDTGNASGGAAHLHFEVRKGGEALDPYPRITKEYTLKEKMESVENAFENFKDEDELADFLVQNFTKEFTAALNAGYDLPEEIEDELKDRGIVSVAALVKQLAQIIASIPKVVTSDLTLNSQGSAVSLVQLFLIYEKSGPAATALSQAGATGYFGPVTQAAMMEYQLKAGTTATGIYNAQTRAEMTK